jgi:nitroreductase
MNAKDAILSRRSCRKFILDKLVPKEIVEDILLAGRSAPTGMNTQLVKFHVVFNNTKLLQSIGEKCFNGLPDEVKPRLIKRKPYQWLTLTSLSWLKHTSTSMAVPSPMSMAVATM